MGTKVIVVVFVIRKRVPVIKKLLYKFNYVIFDYLPNLCELANGKSIHHRSFVLWHGLYSYSSFFICHILCKVSLLCQGKTRALLNCHSIKKKVIQWNMLPINPINTPMNLFSISCGYVSFILFLVYMEVIVL